MASIQNCLLNAFVHLLYYADTLNAFTMSSHILPIISDTAKELRQSSSSAFGPVRKLSHGIVSAEQLLILAAIYGLERFI